MNIPYNVLDELQKAESIISQSTISEDVRKDKYLVNRLRDIGSDLELLIEELRNNA